MTIYLYVKTHLVTGLKYLGQTQNPDPHSYPGSGMYWKLHLKKHGSLYNTEILKECQDKDELRLWGLYYSNQWNVVESDEWANLTEEKGAGGRMSAEVRKRISETSKGRVPWNKGKSVWNEEGRRVIGERNKARGPQSAETIAKRVAKTTGKVRTDETRIRMSAAQKGRTFSDETKLKMSEAAKRRCAAKKAPLS